MGEAVAPWIAVQRDALLAQRGHAWLLHGPSGLGQYALALELVRAWLCDAPTGHGACGQCASCHGVDVRTHADLCVLMPETQMLALGWPLPEKAQGEIDDKKRKPSREIRVEAMRDAVEFAQRTSARGRGKAVLVYPAEQMNHVTANALLTNCCPPSAAAAWATPCSGPRRRTCRRGWRGRAWRRTRPTPSCARQAGGPTTRWPWPAPAAARRPGL
jgi:hypothetical protein